MQDLVVLAQTRCEERVRLEQGLDLGFGVGLGEAEASLGHCTRLGAQGTTHWDDVFVRLQPRNVRWEWGGADVATVGLVGDDHGKEHGVQSQGNAYWSKERVNNQELNRDQCVHCYENGRGDSTPLPQHPNRSEVLACRQSIK